MPLWIREKIQKVLRAQLAAAEMEHGYVSDLERDTRNPSVVALPRIAEALEIEPHVLLMKV